MVNETTNVGYKTFRNTLAAASADTDLADDTKTWDNFKTNWLNAGYDVFTAQAKTNAVVITFDHKNADADTATFVLYAYADRDCPAEFVCQGNLLSGAQETDDSTTRYYADTIDTTTRRWIADVSFSDASGNDGVAKVAFDLCGYKYLICLFTAISAGDDVRAKIRYF